jgi:AraC-like DNA-binding protein
MIEATGNDRSRSSPRPIAVTWSGCRQRSITDLVIDYVEQNYTMPISLRDVASAIGYSACHLTTTFRESTGTPITAWIIKRRILAAKLLLSADGVTVATACEAAGFTDLCYFTRQFVRHVGVTPGRFRSEVDARPDRHRGIDA